MGDNLAYLSRFLTKGGLPFVLLLLAPALLPAVFPGVPRTAASMDGGWAAYAIDALIWGSGIAIGASVPLLFLLSIRLLCKKWLPRGPEMKEDRRISILIFYVAFFGLYALFAFPLYDWTSPAFAICTLLGVLLMIYALFQYFVNQASASFGRWPVPPGAILAGLSVLIFGLANNDPYKLSFPEMTAYYHSGSHGIVDLRKAVREQYGHERKPLPQGGANLIEDRVALQNWLAVVKAQNGAGSKARTNRARTNPSWSSSPSAAARLARHSGRPLCLTGSKLRYLALAATCESSPALQEEWWGRPTTSSSDTISTRALPRKRYHR